MKSGVGFKIDTLRVCIRLLLFIVSGVSSIACSHMVTVGTSGGRFGDQLFMYVRAKHIAYILNAPFLYKPFLYSDQLVLHEKEKQSISDKRHTEYISCARGSGIIFNHPGLRYCCAVPRNMPLKKVTRRAKHALPVLFVVDFSYDISACLTDDAFLSDIQNLIAPIVPLVMPSIPSDRYSIAVHVRTGGGFDSQATIKNFTQHFLPLEYYYGALQEVGHLVKNKQMYVHLFTDDSDPQGILEQLKGALDGKDVQYACRTQGNRHDTYVLDDFFAMTKFDCLIRSGSTFAHMAEILGDHAIVVSPKRESPSLHAPVLGADVMVKPKSSRAWILEDARS